jgi:hypothetical protein
MYYEVVIMFTDEDKQNIVCTEAGSKADDKRSCNVVFGRIV